MLHFYIFLLRFPLADVWAEATAIGDGFRHGKAVQKDVYVTGIRGRVDLLRYIVGMFPLAPVGQNSTDRQMMHVPFRVALSESEQLPCNNGFIIRDDSVERYCNPLVRRFFPAGK